MPRAPTESPQRDEEEDFEMVNKDDTTKQADNDEEMEDDEEDLADGEFVIEKIMRHRFDDDGKLMFLIKWQGYEKKSDQTWEPEENCDGAPEAIKAFFDSLGGRPKQPDAKTPGKAGRGRPSLSSTPAASTPSAETKSSTAKKNKGNKSAVNTPGGGEDKWKPPVDAASWEDEVRQIDTLEKINDELIAYVHWNNGRKTQHPTHVVYKKCPQVMLRFYESHLVFREPGGDSS